MYVLLYLEAHPERSVEAVNSELMFLGAEPIQEEPLFDSKIPVTREELQARYRGAIFALIREILDPKLEFVPTWDTEKCASCEFKVMCGRQWVRERRW